MTRVDKVDQRREAGQRTRAGLQAAALELLSQRGQEGVTLREITDLAGANVAAVSYHFGSLKKLCEAAIEHALEQYLNAQIGELEALPSTATLQEVAGAFARPMVRALAAGGPDLAVMRTVARVGIEPPRGGSGCTGSSTGPGRESSGYWHRRCPMSTRRNSPSGRGVRRAC